MSLEDNTDSMNTGSGDDKPVKYSDDYHRAIEEVKQLRMDESALRHENLQLKEQLLRLKMSIDAAQEKQQSVGTNLQNLYTPPALHHHQIPLSFIAIAIILTFLGILCGKYMF